GKRLHAASAAWRRGTEPPLKSPEEIVALVVDDDERREVDDLDAPDRLHPELGVLEDLDLLDVVLGEDRGRAPDRAEVEAAVLAAGVGPGGWAVALRERQEAPAALHEQVDVRVHPSRRRRPERPGGVARGRLRGARVVDRVVLHVLRQVLAVLEALA